MGGKSLNNFQCFCYASKAIDNILKSNIVLDAESFYTELYYLFDLYDKKSIERIVRISKSKFFNI